MSHKPGPRLCAARLTASAEHQHPTQRRACAWTGVCLAAAQDWQIVDVPVFLASGSGSYVRPDVRTPSLILDATLGEKPPGTPQLNYFEDYSGLPVTVVRPTQLGGSYTLVPGTRVP
jgi:hypothetical protein